MAKKKRKNKRNKKRNKNYQKKARIKNIPKAKKGVIKLTEEQNKALEYFITAPLRSADRLMKELYDNDDSFYETSAYAWVGEADAKKLFLFGVAKEVMKASTGLVTDKEFLQEVPDETNQSRQGKIIIGSISDVQTYRIRKLIELLSLLILFDRNTADDKEYRVYLSAENLDQALSRQKDFNELFDGRSISNTQHSIDEYNKRINDDLQSLRKTEIWFLNNRRLADLYPSVLENKRKIFLDALLVANADERIALGTSYGRGYSRTSKSIHPSLGSHDYGGRNNKSKHLVTNFSYISIIAMHIMHLAYKIAGKEDPEGLTKLMGENFENSEAEKHIAKLSKEFNVGDIVLTVWTDLVKITEEYTSKYGYKAYKVKYISRPPLKNFPEDWLEAQSILGRLMTKDMVRDFYKKSAKSVKDDKDVSEIMEEVVKLPEEELMKYAEKAFLRFHEMRVLIPMLLESGFLKKKDAPEI